PETWRAFLVAVDHNGPMARICRGARGVAPVAGWQTGNRHRNLPDLPTMLPTWCPTDGRSKLTEVILPALAHPAGFLCLGLPPGPQRLRIRPCRPGISGACVSMPTVLITDSLSPAGLNLLKSAGLQLDVRSGLKPLEVREALKTADGIIIRSGTTLT